MSQAAKPALFIGSFLTNKYYSHFKSPYILTSIFLKRILSKMIKNRNEILFIRCFLNVKFYKKIKKIICQYELADFVDNCFNNGKLKYLPGKFFRKTVPKQKNPGLSIFDLTNKKTKKEVIIANFIFWSCLEFVNQ